MSVKKFYSDLQYPGKNSQISYLWTNRILKYLFEKNKKFTFLDAGCGAGRHSAGLLSVFKNSYGYLLDFSTESLKLAQNCLDENKLLSRAEIINSSFLEPFDLKEKVDLALVIGTIHHTNEPIKSLKNICKNVKPGGFIAIMVYSKRGHKRRYEIKEFLNLLTTDNEEKLKLYNEYKKKYETIYDMSIREIYSNIKKFIRHKINFKGIGYYYSLEEKIKYSDWFLNPIDNAFDTSEIYNITESAGLEIVNFFGFGEELKDFFSETFKDKYQKLNDREKTRVREILHQQPGSWSILCKKL